MKDIKRFLLKFELDETDLSNLLNIKEVRKEFDIESLGATIMVVIKRGKIE